MTRCPVCHHESLVIDSRPTGSTTRRRRTCLACASRWSTIEVVVKGRARGEQLARLIVLADRFSQEVKRLIREGGVR